ncbi:MAG TPA: hypothetical protein VLA12_11325, partial [Planctomycetaceae bacterium]|nr:hypothetical protein [Planctomycetaceae bacterium]
ESTALQQHLDQCPECREFLDELRGVNGLLQSGADQNRQQAHSIAERVISQLPPSVARVEPAVPVPSRTREFLFMLAGLAVGFLCAWGLFSNDSGSNSSDDPTIASNETEANNADPKLPGTDSPIALPQAVARLVRIIGNVSVGSQVDVPLTRVSQANPVSCVAESVVQTGPDSRCELLLASGSVVRLNSGTRLLVRSPRQVEIHEGQLFCSAPEGTELNVVAVKIDDAMSKVPTFTCPSNGSMWTSNSPRGVQVSSASGEIAVQTSDSELKLKTGQSVEVIEGEIQPVSNVTADPLLATRWIHPLLIQKGAQDPELKSRVDAMLARIGQSKLSSLYESEIRSLGEYCVLPLIRYLESPQSQTEPARRETAARIIADLATTWTIGDLIGLLESEDGIVRERVAVALQRLTSENHGTSPEQWQESRPSETLELWKAWWSENLRHYPSLDELNQQEIKENTL